MVVGWEMVEVKQRVVEVKMSEVAQEVVEKKEEQMVVWKVTNLETVEVEMDWVRVTVSVESTDVEVEVMEIVSV